MFLNDGGPQPKTLRCFRQLLAICNMILTTFGNMQYDFDHFWQYAICASLYTCYDRPWVRPSGLHIHFFFFFFSNSVFWVRYTNHCFIKQAILEGEIWRLSTVAMCRKLCFLRYYITPEKYWGLTCGHGLD